MKEITEQDAYQRMAAYCSTSEHCRAEVEEKLRNLGQPIDVIKRIVSKLENDNFIDEERYCSSFVNDKFKFNKWGKRKIAQALYLKKIPSPTAWKHLNEIDNAEYIDVLRNLIDSKKRSIRADSEYELKGKLIRFAVSRGFDMEDINKCISMPD